MVKVLSLSFEQFFGLLTMLLVEASSERGLFRHLINHVFWSPSVQKSISYVAHLFLHKLKNAAKFIT